MRDLVERLRVVEREVAADFGEFALFAVFVTGENLHGRGDIYIAARWMGEDDERRCRMRISAAIRERLPSDDFLRISRIRAVEVTHPDFSKELRYYPTGGRVVEISQRELFGKDVERGLLITCRPDLMGPPLPAGCHMAAAQDCAGRAPSSAAA